MPKRKDVSAKVGRGFKQLPLAVLREGSEGSSDCGPRGPGSVKVENVKGEGNDPASAVRTAHTNAKSLGQASCDGQNCTAPKSCKYVEDSWTVSVVPKNQAHEATGTSTGHCSCEG